MSHYFDSEQSDNRTTASRLRKCVICDIELDRNNEPDICPNCQMECEKLKKILNYLNIHNETQNITDDLTKEKELNKIYTPFSETLITAKFAEKQSGTTVLGTDDVFYTGILEDENSLQMKRQTAIIIRLKTNERIAIDKPVFIIGKSKSKVDFLIKDNKTISRKHIQIITKPDGYFLMDANSTNGTFLNGNGLKPFCETPLLSGDKFFLSDEEFAFVIERE
ncbi:MAG: FHA domain-containing protein [Oscillospiraceae bacterium]